MIPWSRIFEDHRGRIWVSTRRGVAYFENGRFTPVSRRAGRHTYIPSSGTRRGICGVNEAESLFRLSGGAVVERIPWAPARTQGQRHGPCSPTLCRAVYGSDSMTGVAYFKDGQIRASYAAADGLGQGRVTGLQLDRDGTLWAATEGGLSRRERRAYRHADEQERVALRHRSLGRWKMTTIRSGCTWPAAWCALLRPELDAVGDRSDADDPGHGFRQLRRRQEPFAPSLQPACRQVVGWQDYGS